jgi:hypothetical protein
MAEDYKSLLGRPGSSFADIASAYITGNRKSDNRARNVLLASLFFNAKEANMQAKVIKNLKELDQDKSLELAKLNAQWDKRTKLQTEYDQLQRDGALVYFEDKLDRDFENQHKQHKDIMNLSSNDIETYKLNWKKTEAEKYKKELEDRYKGIDRGITVKEEFQKPYMDYYDAQKEKILNPANTSLVHKMFSKIGMGTEAPDLQKIKQNFTNDQARIKTFTQKEAQAIENAVPVREEILGLKINQKDFSTLLSESVYLAENPQARMRAAKQFADSTQTASKAQNIILQLQLKSEILSSEFKLNEIERNYTIARGDKPSEKNPQELQLWQDGLERFKRQQMGISDVSDVIMNNIAGLERIATQQGVSIGDKEKLIKDMVGETIRKATGEVNYKEIAGQYQKGALYTLTENIRTGDYNTKINATVLDLDSIKILEQKAPKAYKILTDNKNDILKLNDNFNTLPPSEQLFIRNLQKELFTETQTKAILAIGRILGNFDPNS